MFDYFYGAQSEQFAFYRVPKVLFTNDRFKYLSAEAKTLYGILLDRVPLSAKNGWIDEQGRVYIICTIEEIMADMNCGNKKAVQLLADLETKVGLIERKRQGLGKPNLIYVKNFISVDNPVERHFLKCQNDTSGSVERTCLEVSKGHGTNTDMNHTEYSDTDSTAANTRHALCHASIDQPLVEISVGILKSTVTVDDRTRIRIALDSLCKSVEHKLVVVCVPNHKGNDASVI